MAVLFVLLGLALLLPPSAWFFRRRTTWWTYERILNESRLGVRAWWHSHQPWDLARAGAGFAGVRFGLGLALSGSPAPDLARDVALVFAALLGVVAQVVVSDKAELALAPAAWVAGVLAAWLPWPVLAPALALGVVSVAAFRRLEPGFILGAVGLVPLGYILEVPPVTLGGAVATALAPWAYAWTAQRSLALRVRRRWIERAVEGRPHSRLRDATVPASPRTAP